MALPPLPPEMHDENYVPPPATPLSIRIEPFDGSSFPGSVVEVDDRKNMARILVDFSRDRAPFLEIGTKVLILFDQPHTTAPEIATGVTIFMSEDPVRKRYQFQVGNAMGIPRVRRALGRMATRVRPFPRVPVPAAIRHLDGGQPCPVTLKDISATGAGLYVPIEAEADFYADWKLLLALALPAEPATVGFVVHVRHRRKLEDAIRYGVDFDAAETDGFHEKQEAVQRYVAGCQSGWLWAIKNAWVDEAFADREQADSA